MESPIEYPEYDNLDAWTGGEEQLGKFFKACLDTDGVDILSAMDLPGRAEPATRIPRAFEQIMRACEGVFATNREPDLVIANNKEGEGQVPYMRRWYMVPRNRFCNVYLHHFQRSDIDDALHDHPWRSLSFVLGGEGIEHLPNDQSREVKPGDVIYRGSHHAHRVELPEGRTLTTLFITGPVVRDWGFHCPGGWKHWEEFLGGADNYGGRVAGYPGCGET